MTKQSQFLVELEKFINSVEKGMKWEEIHLENIFYNVIENLEKLDENFSVEKGMDLKKHIIVPDGDAKKNGILFSEQLSKAIELA